MHGRRRPWETCHRSLSSLSDAFAKESIPLGCPCVWSSWSRKSLSGLGTAGEECILLPLLVACCFFAEGLRVGILGMAS